MCQLALDAVKVTRRAPEEAIASIDLQAYAQKLMFTDVCTLATVLIEWLSTDGTQPDCFQNRRRRGRKKKQKKKKKDKGDQKKKMVMNNNNKKLKECKKDNNNSTTTETTTR